MIVLLISLFLTGAAHAEAKPIVVANCECIVYDDAGVPINPPTFLNTPLPVITSLFEVNGEGSIKTDYEKAHCKEEAPGELSMACAVAAVKAKYNATHKCGQLAHRYHPEKMDGFTNGELAQGSCILSIQD